MTESTSPFWRFYKRMLAWPTIAWRRWWELPPRHASNGSVVWSVSGSCAGFHGDVDPRAMGVGLEAMIAVRLRLIFEYTPTWRLPLPV